MKLCTLGRFCTLGCAYGCAVWPRPKLTSRILCLLGRFLRPGICEPQSGCASGPSCPSEFFIEHLPFGIRSSRVCAPQGELCLPGSPCAPTQYSRVRCPLLGPGAWSPRGCPEMQLTLAGIRMMSGSSSSGVKNKITKDLNLET